MKTILSLVFFALSSFSAIQGQDLSLGLLLHYPLDGNASDISGNSRHGQITGAMPASDRFGNNMGALQFGNATLLAWPGDPELKPDFPFSTSCWVYCDDFPPFGRGIMTNDFVENRYYGIILSYNFNRQVLISIGDGGLPNPDGRRTKAGNTMLQAGQWYHIVAVVRGLTDMDLYINGCNDEGVYSGNGDALAYSDGGQGALGLVDDDATTASPFLYHPGRLDDFRLWNRALTEEEVELLYDQFYDAPFSLGPDTTLCVGESLVIDATVTVATSYTWQDGASTPVYTVLSPGVYQLEVEIGHKCSFSDTLVVQYNSCSICNIYFPNAFSPNSDGINDDFRVYFDTETCRFESYSLKIFNRWGGLVFESNDPFEPWSGKINSKNAAQGVYTYLVSYQLEGASQIDEHAGSISLVR
ncbi:MAG: gliding motility-associated C-terminal domain-containing protein [Saprospiraceae bacterium]|nr:gliding motility-associated C-terminal domain-containing protein [Saprospiraceae bacterium]